jgi:serine/threonine protein kinase
VWQSFRCEAITWKYLRHDHIVPFLGIWDVFSPGVCLVSEWMPEGSISQFLKRHPEVDRLPHVSPCLRLASRLWLKHEFQIRDIVSGLDFMHQIGVIHGDLKSVRLALSSALRL